MRRESDIRSNGRSGRGRRARDRLLGDDPPGGEADLLADPDSELCNLLLLSGDDLREAALAVGGIEQYLVAVHGALADERGCGARTAALLERDDLDERLGALEEALVALRRRLHRIRVAAAGVARS
jgi:hypothetical protein